MTNDELLAGFLDRSLSEDQLLEFQERRESDPEFAQHVLAMLRIEQALPIAAPSVSAPVALFQSVEATVMSHIAQHATHVGIAASVGGLGGAIKSTLSTVATSVWTYATAAGLAAIGAGVAYFSDPATSLPSSPGSRVVAVADAPRARPVELRLVAPHEESPSRGSRAGVERRDRDGVQWTTAADVPKFTNRTHRLDVQAPSADPALESLLGDLDRSRTDSDLVRSAQIGLAIGRTYRERGQHMLAERYLGKSLIDARQSRVVEYEVEVLTELALNANATGRRTDARGYAQKAQSVAERAGITYQPLEFTDSPD